MLLIFDSSVGKTKEIVFSAYSHSFKYTDHYSSRRFNTTKSRFALSFDNVGASEINT